LGALEAAKLTKRDRDVSYQNTVWSWVGPVPERAPKPDVARPRPSPRPWQRPLIEQEGAEMEPANMLEQEWIERERAD